MPLPCLVDRVGQDLESGVFTAVKPVRTEYDSRLLANALFILKKFYAFIAELDRVMRITEELLRHMIVAKNEKKAEKQLRMKNE